MGVLEATHTSGCILSGVELKVMGDALRPSRSSGDFEIKGALAFATASGQSVLGAAMEWLNRHQPEVSA